MTTRTWQTDEPCPKCGRGLHFVENADDAQVGWDCRTCGWSATWLVEADLNQVVDGRSADQRDQCPPSPGSVLTVVPLGIGGADVSGQRGVDAA
jgi:hypothetical protein